MATFNSVKQQFEKAAAQSIEAVRLELVNFNMSEVDQN